MGRGSQLRTRPGRPTLPKGKAKGKIVPIRFAKAEAEQLADHGWRWLISQCGNRVG